MSSFVDFRLKVKELSKSDNFKSNCFQIEKYVFSLSIDDVKTVIKEIGSIPEDIGHDSTEEKLYTKASDILFARALKEMNFDVKVLEERSNSADIEAKSKFHNYSLVGDAKAFRLSRTARNAKDYKVDAMSRWRGNCKYSVLACPYYQYPNSRSQIYKEAIEGNVCLFSWELLFIFLELNIKETENISLEDIWNQSAIIGSRKSKDAYLDCFLREQNNNICRILNISTYSFNSFFDRIINGLKRRGEAEIEFYNNVIEDVKKLSHEDAIRELVKALKLNSKIDVIKDYINKL